MSGEEQERFEDYLELERYIEQLRLNKSAHPPTNLTPQQMRIYRMAMLFHSASPHVADPRPEFTTQLRQRLLEQVRTGTEIGREQEQAGRGQAPSLSMKSSQTAEQQKKGEEEIVVPPMPVERESAQAEVKQRKARRVSRRALLTGGTVAAASLLAGAGIEHTIAERSQPPNPPHQYPPLVGNVPTGWHLVASVEQLGQGAIRFTADTVIGYVMRKAENGNEASTYTTELDTEEIIAFSAACTHMGCIVQWQEKKRQFLCPCHNGTFDDHGNPVRTPKGQLYLTSLPRLETKIENDNIYVKVALPPT